MLLWGKDKTEKNENAQDGKSGQKILYGLAFVCYNIIVFFLCIFVHFLRQRLDGKQATTAFDAAGGRRESSWGRIRSGGRLGLQIRCGVVALCQVCSIRTRPRQNFIIKNRKENIFLWKERISC